MRFFEMKKPETDTDYADIWINGSANPKYGFPGVSCSVCENTRGLAGGIMPYPLPDDLPIDTRLADWGAIPDTEHRALRLKIEDHLRRSGHNIERLPGGALFPPITWELPSRPEADVFWASYLGPIVSARAATALRSAEASGIALIPVDHVRCGTRSPSDKVPIPESGEPVDLLEQATETLEGVPFFFCSVISEGRLTTNMHESPACPGCGHIQIDRSNAWAVWDDKIWPGDDIFHFPTTLRIVVTERIADLLTTLGAKNVAFTSLVQT